MTVTETPLALDRKEFIQWIVAEHPFNYFGTVTFKRKYPPNTYRETLQQFCANIDKKRLGKKYRDSDDRLFFFGFLEKADQHPHYHLLIKSDDPLPTLRNLVHQSWEKIGTGKGTDFKKIYDLAGAVRYATKESEYRRAGQSIEFEISSDLHGY